MARIALEALDRGDRTGFLEVRAPTVPLARHVFAAPTYHDKTGLVFLSFLTGHQDHFRMVAGAESACSAVHLGTLLRLHVVALAGVGPDA